jgi:hypothetical protein
MRPTLCSRLEDPSGRLHAHFWPQGTTFNFAPPGSVAVSSLSGRPAAAAGMLPWARGLAVLSRRPFWRLVHKKSGRSPGRSNLKKSRGRTQNCILNLQVVRLEPSTPWQSDQFTAVLEGLHIRIASLNLQYYGCQADLAQIKKKRRVKLGEDTTVVSLDMQVDPGMI